jgi:hypothetical protein
VDSRVGRKGSELAPKGHSFLNWFKNRIAF